VSANSGTQFRKKYERGDLPIIIRHGAKSVLEWKVPISSLDVSYFLPIFVDGIREQQNPFRFIASEGTFQLISDGLVDQIHACVDSLIYPLKRALDTHDSATIILALRVIQSLSSRDLKIGEDLVRHYKQLLPVFNIYKSRKRNLGDQIDFAQSKHDGRTIGETIEETLAILQETGGSNAFALIKYIVPTYENCVS